MFFFTMKKVDFLIGGVQKGGTTSLSAELSAHPDILFSKKKEIHYFDLHYKKSESWYHKHFAFMPNKINGECSPFYMYWRPCYKRIHTYNPNIKWIFLLRNPIERAFSAYTMSKNRNRESLTFSEAIRTEHIR
ncbi:MAG: sulfotransferase, partial [Candidatus Moranbacteria bacterium]|nr:sulfotransferase [Candidatus Moranbacteria bacterium]